MMSKVSGSVMGRVIACPASAVLPHQDKSSAAAERGSAIHAYLRDAMVLGKEQALEKVAPDLLGECDAIDLDAIDEVLGGGAPVGAQLFFEPALVYDTANDTARVIGENIGRNYGELKPTEIPMSLDVLRVLETRIIIIDYKTGVTAMTPEQSFTQAVGAARAFDKSEVTVYAMYLQNDGSWRWTRTDYNAFDLDAHADEIRNANLAVQRQQAKYDAGQTVDVNTGDHCKWCPAQLACPSVTALVPMLSKELGAPNETQLIAPERLGVLYAQAEQLEKTMQAFRERVEAIAKVSPIPLPNGGTLKEVQTKRESIDAEIAAPILAALGLSDAVKPSTTKSAIEAAIKRLPPNGKTVKEKIASVLEALREKDAVKESISTRVTEVKR
jgi:hypothetical protein